MATVIFTEQENGGQISTVASEDGVILTSVGKRLVRSRRGKVFGSASGEKTIRKALGDVNKQVMTQKSVQPLKGDRKVKKPTPAAKKAANVPSKPDKQQYPTIEKCVPYNPADFESFAVPEEHKLSHCSLAGVGLLMNGTNAKNLLHSV
ncbi:Regulatory protein [Pristimantis euphronides]